jgi:hypothetical protein
LALHGKSFSSIFKSEAGQHRISASNGLSHQILDLYHILNLLLAGRRIHKLINLKSVFQFPDSKPDLPPFNGKLHVIFGSSLVLNNDIFLKDGADTDALADDSILFYWA